MKTPISPISPMRTRLAWFFIVLMLSEICLPTAALALTSGPAQPEASSFEPVGTTEMVNLFSGDFTYNIPLFEVPGPDGGYPVNLFYNSATNAEEEATWTGLGWNINIGSLSRSMRGLPDDFSGEQVSRRLDMKPNVNLSTGAKLDLELAGLEMSKALENVELGTSLSLNLSYTWNSYKGSGLSLGLGAGAGLKADGDYQPNLNMGVTLSGLEDANFNAGFSISKETTTKGAGSTTTKRGSFNAGISLNGRNGMENLTLGISSSTKVELSLPNFLLGGFNKVSFGKGSSYSGSISFAKPSYSPSVSIPWSGFNVSGAVTFNPGTVLTHGEFGINGNASFQWVSGEGQWQESKAYGYNYMHERDGIGATMDYNHEKDGALGLHSRFLGIPSMTHDVYSVVGQGVGGVYRAHRPEFGWLLTPFKFSATGGFNVGVEAGAAWKIGVDGTVNLSKQAIDSWISTNNVRYGNDNEYDVHREPFYYKASGDISSEKLSSYDYMGGEKPLRLRRFGFEALPVLENTYNSTVIDFGFQNSDINNRKDRKKRNMSIQPITNAELWNTATNNELLPEYDIQCYDLENVNQYGNPPTEQLQRPSNSQNAGFTVVGQNGVRWVYGLPVMNKKHREVLFSVDNSLQSICDKRTAIRNENGTIASNANEDSKVFYKAPNSNEYLDEKNIPAYAHTYMLTSVVGADYADVDGIAGPSEGDVGYWMKTNYVRVADNYQWRAPYTGANYIKGQENSIVDDLGSFMWGVREVYLPATIETKTHIAYFDVSKRYDARGAADYIANAGNSTNGEYSYKLDRIKLYSKKEINAKGLAQATPLKTIHFEYDYSLCKGVENNHPGNPAIIADNPNITETTGKLTLKKLWFTYERSTRGSLSPYEFEYEAPNVVSNYNYVEKNIDRWGAFKSGTDGCDLIENPYVRQFKKDGNGLNSAVAMQEELDEAIANWHIKQIKTPSGAVIKLEMERDDYAYVQDKVATQMMPIDAFQNDNRDIYFELEQPISANLSSAEQQALLDKYTEDLPIVTDPRDNTPNRRQVYLKVRVNLRNAEQETYETIPVYATLSQDQDGKDIYIDPSSLQGSGANAVYTKAFVRLNEAQIKTVTDDPISVFAWQYLRDNLPNKIYELDLGSETGDFSGLSAAGPSLEALFTGYFNYARNKGFGGTLVNTESFIKLNSPDKIKYGGNLRVKKVELDDQWVQNTATSTLGVVYDYSTEDSEGNEISSGVLQNEPTVGADACALRFAEVYYERLMPGTVDDIHVFELPMNESYYPAGSVGYSEVTVRSLASDYAKQQSEGQTIPSDLPSEFSTTGQTVNTFYTAKDFPVITSSTSISKEAVMPWVNALASVVGVSHDIYAGTQGYSIELNDMHGKPKSITTYAQDKGGAIAEEPLTKVEYKYKEQNFVKDGKVLKRLYNEVDVLLADLPDGSNNSFETEKRLVGVEQEFFVDTRRVAAAAMSFGIEFNADVVVWWPAILPWPFTSFNVNDTRTSATNKVIMRYGILEETHAYDGQSHIVTTNKVFNAQTGAPILTTVDNQLEGKIYNYTVPADLAHASMGSAAKNWGRKLTGTLDAVACTNYYEFTSAQSPNLDHMVPGDEYIITSGSNKGRAVYMGWLSNGTTDAHQFDLIGITVANGSTVELKNIRSGYRNLLDASIAQYSAVDLTGNDGNPLTNRTLNTVNTEFIQIGAPSGSTVGLSAVAGPDVSYLTIDHVLSASANAYKDEWTVEHSDPCLTLPENPYLSGEKGIWRPQSTYSYIADRNLNELSNGDIDIRTSGVVDGVPLFNWKNPFFEYAQVAWVRTEDITKYNLEGAAIEARDVLGNYQAEIYGKDDNLVVAKGVNTRYYEMGFESFEDPNQDDDLQTVANAGNFNTGNLNFLPPPSNCTNTTVDRQENYRLSSPMQEPNGGKGYILVRKHYDATNALPNGMVLNFYNGDKKEEITIGQPDIQQFGLNLTTGQRFKIPGLAIVLDEDTKDEFTVYELDFASAACGVNLNQTAGTDWWAGDATLVFEENLNSNPVIPTVVEYTTDKAHTGKYSLKMIMPNAGDPISPKLIFPQTTLRLQKGKEYVFSAWISKVGAEDLFTLADPDLEVLAFGSSITPNGPVIEGWQRVEGKFVFNGDNTLTFRHFSDEQGENNVLFLDDVRVFPHKANMQSYVYDPVDYKLRATLDNNNYATFYVYNRAGDLILVKRETERGVKTIQESRNFIQPTN